MATTTPNYLWSVPTSSDLVKNGATAIETLGDSVDASLWSSGFGQAGKNKIINGDFNINQRAFVSTTTNNDYGFDRMRLRATDGTVTYSAQTFTVGTAPVAGYEATNYARIVTSGQTNASTAAAMLRQTIEDVRTFAGQTITISFWAKANTGTPFMNAYITQSFGSGGSTAVSANVTKQAITTLWARYSFTISVPSIAGKTIGAGSYLLISIVCSAGTSFLTDSFVQNNTFDIWGFQVEAGSYATPFQTASGGSPQAELAMCQRYYWRATVDGVGDRFGYGSNISTTDAQIMTQFPVQMRSVPSALETTGTAGDYSVVEPGSVTPVCTAAPTFLNATNWSALTTFTTGGTLTAFRPSAGRSSSASAYLGWSAEL